MDLRVGLSTLLLVMLSGCGPENRTPVAKSGETGKTAPPTEQNQSELPQVEHPEYAHWKQFPVGTYVVRKKEVSDSQGTVKVTTVIKLTNLTPEKVTYQQQVTVDHPSKPLKQNPPQDFDAPAKFRLPEGFKIEQFEKPSLSAKEVLEEKKSAAGNEYPCKLYTWTETNEAGPMPIKLWYSNQMPGRLVRQESAIPENKSSSIEEVIEVFIPGKTDSGKK